MSLSCIAHPPQQVYRIRSTDEERESVHLFLSRSSLACLLLSVTFLSLVLHRQIAGKTQAEKRLAETGQLKEKIKQREEMLQVKAGRRRRRFADQASGMQRTDDSQRRHESAHGDNTWASRSSPAFSEEEERIGYSLCL